MRAWNFAAFVLAGCATLAGEAGDQDAVRPNAGAGPFRAVTDAELREGASAPYLLRQKFSDYREPSVLALGDRVPGPTALYLTATQGQVDGIYRFVADDGRSFEAPDPAGPVIAVSETWEGAWVGAPSVARVGAEIFLFYAAEGGIGLARSADGTSFEKLGRVLEQATSPGFVEQAPGDYRLFFEDGGTLGEAKSTDGLVWQRVAGAVLDRSSDSEAFDAESVGDPEALVAESAEGRRITRVYYTGRDADGRTAIGLAARHGTDGPLSRAVAPAFASARDPAAPALMVGEGLSLLYYNQRAGTGDAQAYPAIALAVTPATITLPPP